MDFFVFLNQNLSNWPDVFSFFSFQMVSSTTCSSCGAKSASEFSQIYEEMQVPPDNSILKTHIEEVFNGSTTVESFCHNNCKKTGRGEKRTTLKSVASTRFIIIILSRAINTGQGFQLVKNQCRSTDDILIR